MIRELTLEDNLAYLNLGKELSPSFMKSYDLKYVLVQEYNKVYGYFLNDVLVGFIHIQISIDEADIVNIIVEEKHRFLGIGRKLIEYVIEKHDLKALNLEVREDNNAINFYEKLDFKIYRTIPNYYSDKTNAKFMKKVIIDE